jgi:two-component system, sensor histidine kinase and response regulator
VTSARILIVDDHDENLVALEAMLARPGVEIDRARTGADALELVLRNVYAVAIIDVVMPDMDGFELAELLRGTRRASGIPLIFVTAGARDPGPVFKGYEAGAVDFLHKPLEPAVLRGKVDVFLELFRHRRELAEQLEERERLVAELRDQLRLNETFAAVLGHDLRNPLSAVLTSALLMQRRGDGDPATVARIVSSGKRMARMIDQLLDFTRARVAGGFHVDRHPASFAALTHRMIGELAAAFPERDIRVAVRGDDAGSWDADRVGQVISNLVGNAARHGARGAPIRVEVDGTEAEAVTLLVRNAGAIPPDLLPSLFEPFRSRADGRQGDGLGLGLFIVRQIVEAHGGEVSVASTPEDGTTFTAVFPRGDVASEPAPSPGGVPAAADCGGAR